MKELMDIKRWGQSKWRMPVNSGCIGCCNHWFDLVERCSFPFRF